MAKRLPQRLKFKVPWLFEAEGEGAGPVVIVASLSIIFLVLLFLVAHR